MNIWSGLTTTSASPTAPHGLRATVYHVRKSGIATNSGFHIQADSSKGLGSATSRPEESARDFKDETNSCPGWVSGVFKFRVCTIEYIKA